MSIQVVKKKQRVDYVIIPYDEFITYANEGLIEAAYIQDILTNPVDGEIMDFDFGNHVDNPVQLRRLRAGFTQKELAEKLGVTQAYVSKLERAQTVSAKALKKVNDILQ